MEIVLRRVAWATLGFRRLMQVDEFRRWGDMGLASFTGRRRLWSDTTLRRRAHGVTRKSAAASYQATAALVAARPDPLGSAAAPHQLGRKILAYAGAAGPP